jgi:hypothetical protein
MLERKKKQFQTIKNTDSHTRMHTHIHLQALALYPRNLNLLQLLEVLEGRAHAYVRLQQVWYMNYMV